MADLGDVVTDPVFALVISTLLAVVAIILSIVLYRRQKAVKELSYRTSITPLVSVREQASDKIKITYEGHEVTQVHLISITIRNRGNVRVVPDDFSRAISIRIPQAAQFFNVEVTETEPADLNPDLQVTHDGIVVSPLLLNPEDSFSVAFLLSDYDPRQGLEVTSRVAGIKSDLINERRQPSPEKRRRARVKDLPSPFRVWTVAVAALASMGTALSVVLVVTSDTNTAVRLKNGEVLCGDILRTGDRTLVFKLEGSGRVRTVPLSDVDRIRENRC